MWIENPILFGVVLLCIFLAIFGFLQFYKIMER